MQKGAKYALVFVSCLEDYGHDGVLSLVQHDEISLLGYSSVSLEHGATNRFLSTCL